MLEYHLWAVHLAHYVLNLHIASVAMNLAYMKALPDPPPPANVVPCE